MVNPERQILRCRNHPFHTVLAGDIADFMRVAEDRRRAEGQHGFGKAARRKQAGLNVQMRIDQSGQDDAPGEVAGFCGADATRRAPRFNRDKASVADSNPALEEPVTEDIGNPSIDQQRVEIHYCLASSNCTARRAARMVIPSPCM